MNNILYSEEFEKFLKDEYQMTWAEFEKLGAFWRYRYFDVYRDRKEKGLV